MTPAENNSQPASENSSPADLNSLNPMVRAVERAVTELQTARVYIERDLKEGRDDIKAVLQSLARLETKVSTLPSKTWIGTAVTGGVAAVGTLIAIIYKIATGH